MRRMFVLLWLALLPASSALAWSRAGHMVTAAIAYEELSAADSGVLNSIMTLAEDHPDRGAFDAAVAYARGEARRRRIFFQLARWPDDVRGATHDHPTWHYSSKPLLDPSSPPARWSGDVTRGSAIEAFNLNLSVAADPAASAAERAVAISWVFHLVGDMHQPLHSVSQVSRRFPKGDRGGGLQYLRDPRTQEPVTLHWFWDDLASRGGGAEKALRRARELMQQLPRAHFPELTTFLSASEFADWVEESRQLGEQWVYTPDLKLADSATTAAPPAQRYVDEATAVAERRLTLAGYRLADVLRTTFNRQERHRD